MKGVKSLYEMMRDKLYIMEYYCEYCDLLDFDEWFMERHIKTWHDECAKPIEMFRCRICLNVMMNSELIRHKCK